MDYFEILNLKKEPFSNSPDPEFFFQSRQHLDCLQKLEISIRLRRGLNVVIGNVGTGKTTLCRQLIRRFADEDKIETHLLLDPHFETPGDFLLRIDSMFSSGSTVPETAGGMEAKERIKRYLFQKGVDDNKTVVLIIDEGQKISPPCLEILRELLNYETNQYKLLQIIIFAQKEFKKVAGKHANFTDRINLYHNLGPLSLRDTWNMIIFRLKQSNNGKPVKPVFTIPAVLAIYLSTGGYPRKIINLCHQSILTMIVQNRSKASWLLIRFCAKRTFSNNFFSWKFTFAAGLAGLAAMIIIAGISSDYLNSVFPLKTEKLERGNPPAKVEPSASIASPAKAEKKKSVEIGAQPEKKGIKGSETILPALVEKKQGDLPHGKPNTVFVQEDNSGEIPEALGRFEINAGESLWLVLHRVYGRFGPKILQKVIAANPHIRDPDNIESGTAIIFPSVRANVERSGLRCWWIRLDVKDTLAEAMNFLRIFSGKEMEPRIIPVFSSDSGLKFVVIIKEFFFDMSTARNVIDRIDKKQAPKCVIMEDWKEGATIFFADPYLS